MEILPFVLIVVIVCSTIAVIRIYRNKRINFVRENSVALRMLTQINSKHSFLPVQYFDMTHSYDNRNYYATISPGDYLTYQLLYRHKEVTAAINNAAENAERMKLYQAEIASMCVFGKFENADQEELSCVDRFLWQIWTTKDLKNVCAIEKNLFDAAIKRPVTAFRIPVIICLTNLRGRRLTYKSSIFYAPEILETIKRIKSKENERFEDPDLWQAITRVERAKVSNRMRFAVYRRDGNRCRKCGSTWNLEVDHIYPISKGGKTTFDNLQTLCHNCNVQKSNFIEPPSVPLRSAYNSHGNICPNCGIPLVRRRGTYNDFWGCPNYPKCKFTKNIAR